MAGPALRSLVVPGWGQLALGQKRGWAYLAAEALALGVHLHFRDEGGDLRDAYRDLAWTVARTSPGAERVDPGFAWFETLEAWATSGAWDREPGRPGVQPETDPATYNGMIWGRARDIYLEGAPDPDPTHPGYGAALAYYEDRAYGPALTWSWTEKEHELNRYRDLIDESDAALRSATHAVGALLANHVLSGVDAWVSANAGADVRSRLTPTPDRRGRTVWTWSVAVAR